MSKKCRSCHRYNYKHVGCYSGNSYVDLETGKTILCPCTECIVRPICELSICPLLRTYHQNKYKHTFQCMVGTDFYIYKTIRKERLTESTEGTYLYVTTKNDIKEIKYEPLY